MAFASPPGDARDPAPAVLDGPDVALARAALAAAESKRWQSALSEAAKASEPLVAKLIAWRYLADDRSGAPFAAIAAFIDANPDWPGLATLTRRAEEAMPEAIPDIEAIAWFTRHPPRTGAGKRRLGEALLAAGDSSGVALLREAWIAHDLAGGEETAFLVRHGARLSAADHVARLDRLLWDGNAAAAHRQLARVDDGRRRLGLARIKLMTGAGGVDAAIARVPDSLKRDPGLIYERARWRRRAGFDDGARALLADSPADLVRPSRWWSERQILARRALDAGEVSAAYRLAADHGQSEAADVAEAEWLAGWIALRFLAEPARAYRHFVAMHAVVGMPISVARAAYWAARAAEAAGVTVESERWYRRAATRPTTFYGQLAILALGGESLTLPAEPPADAVPEFEARELVRLARMLGELGEDELMGAVLARLLDQASSPRRRARIAAIALDYDLAHLAIRAAKRALRADTLLIESAYPVPKALAGHGEGALEPGLLLALARQESEMNGRAVSRAGARGVLQLMPATAQMMARRLGVTYEHARLTSDDAYSLRLGGAYLAGLLADFDGACAIALAAYNAGPARVRQWLRDYGDPRDASVDVVDWIELIPYAETRNYVQRVLEGLQVYRHLLADPAHPPRLRLAEDMVGKPARLAKR